MQDHHTTLRTPTPTPRGADDERAPDAEDDEGRVFVLRVLSRAPRFRKRAYFLADVRM